MTDLIKTQQNGPIFEIILDRVDKRNALNTEMMLGLEQAILQAERATDARVLVIRGEGPSFSAGIDLMGFDQTAEHFGEAWRDNLFPMTHKYQQIFNTLERCTLPVIAQVHGHCIGMAFELILACDIRVAAAGTKLGLPETRLGLIPDVGGTTRLVRLVGPGLAKELILTGRQFDASYAEQRGIVNYAVPVDALADKVTELADELCAAAPLAVSYAKRVVDGVTDIERGLQMEAWAQSVLIRSEDFEHGAQAMMMRQPPQWNGK